MAAPMHPDPGVTRQTRVRIVDGNALAGRLAGLFAVDATVLTLRCGLCGAQGPLANAIVEMDDAAAIVRCRGCTRTLVTFLTTPHGMVMRVGALGQIGAF